MKGHLVKIQFSVGFPMALQYSITAIGSMMMQSALNILGSVVIAGFTAGNKIEQLVTQAYIALGTTMATYSAQNMGAGKIDRIRKGFKNAMIIGTIYSVVTSVLVMTVGKYLTPLFLSENLGQIMGYVDIYLKCAALFFIPLAVVNIFRNGIQGMGYGILPMMAGVAELIGRKRSCCNFCFAKKELYRGVHGKSGCVDFSGRTASYYVLFYYEEHKIQ